MPHKHYVRNAVILQVAVFTYARFCHALTWLVLLMAATTWFGLLLSWLLDSTPPENHGRKYDPSSSTGRNPHRRTRAVPPSN